MNQTEHFEALSKGLVVAVAVSIGYPVPRPVLNESPAPLGDYLALLGTLQNQQLGTDMFVMVRFVPRLCWFGTCNGVVMGSL